MSDTTAYEEYCEASLDLSNQDDVGEAEAIAALDDLYANNDEGMSYEDAIDYLEYNTFNAYVGENTPLWVDDLDLDVLEVMYEYMGHNGHKLREMYESIPMKDSMFNYEQFIVAQFSNLIDQ